MISLPYSYAKEAYAEIGVDTDAAISVAAAIPISMQCWQGDDVKGFEGAGALTGGIAVTGAYPGAARNASELRADIAKALSLIPGTSRLSLHAIYREAFCPREDIRPGHFDGWIDFARANAIALDFNPTFFSHAHSAQGFTLAHPDPNIRRFWIEHYKISREIAAYMGAALGIPCVNNCWIPDGFKDEPADRLSPRLRLIDALDEGRAAIYPREHMLDAVESKLFGIGAESYTVGSHEFYIGYAASRGVLLCLDTGHFHLTESVADKLSALTPFLPGFLLHISRPVRWDSDHVPVFDDALRTIALELSRCSLFGKTHIGMDYFDASINRVAAWVIGMRAMRKALLYALLDPTAQLIKSERTMDYTARLALSEAQKTLPFGLVWAHFLETHDMPGDSGWLCEVRDYERRVLALR